jgi:hypothetical protein
MKPLRAEMGSSQLQYDMRPQQYSREVFCVVQEVLGTFERQCRSVSFMTTNQYVEDRFGVRFELSSRRS